MGGKIVQLGYGKQGKPALYDLLRYAPVDEIVVADAGPNFIAEIAEVEDSRVRPVRFDVEDRESLVDLMRGADVVVELLPVRYTMQVAQAAVEAETHMVSSVFIIDWSVQDPEGVKRQQDEMAEVDRKASEKGLTVLKELGMDPGIDLVIAGETVRALDDVKVLYTHGAGFPEHRLSEANPIGYKFTWSIVDTMYSYSIPGRTLRNGTWVEVDADAMFAPENIYTLAIEELGGPLECFVNGDGNSLARLFPSIAKTTTSLGRYTCRWPGHCAFWEKMVKSGFVRTEPVKVRGTDVIPAEFCAALLGSQDQFHFGPDERDVAFLRADGRGTLDGKPTRAVMQLVDYRDLETGYTAMQRTVGFPMSIGAQMIIDGTITQRGIVSPAEIPSEPFLTEIQKRGLDVTQRIESWDGSEEPGLA
jgi:saccharopine dehydrogenase-like NADP-dependent oxidoreductase